MSPLVYFLTMDLWALLHRFKTQTVQLFSLFLMLLCLLVVISLSLFGPLFLFIFIFCLFETSSNWTEFQISNYEKNIYYWKKGFESISLFNIGKMMIFNHGAKPVSLRRHLECAATIHTYIDSCHMGECKLLYCNLPTETVVNRFHFHVSITFKLC